MSENEQTQLRPLPLPNPASRRGSGPVSVERARLAPDAAGRVEVVALRPPADVLEPAEPAPPAVERPESSVLAALMTRGGWAAIAGLTVVLVAVFVLGLWLTR